MAFSIEYDYTSSKIVYTFPSMAERLYTAQNADIIFAFKITADEYLEIPSHRHLLASLNPIFAAIMADPSTRFEIADVSYTAFKHFLDYFYKQEVNLIPAIIGDMLFLAKQFQMNDLMKCCESFLMEMVCVENVCGILVVYQHIASVVAKCHQTISHNTEEVFQTEAFLRCDRDTLKCILQLEELAVAEITVFEACIAWARNQCERNQIEDIPAHWRNELTGCTELIRFNEMTPAEIAHFIKSNSGFFTDQEVVQLLNASYVANGRFTVPGSSRMSDGDMAADLGFSEC